jgi:hypothetical protein
MVALGDLADCAGMSLVCEIRNILAAELPILIEFLVGFYAGNDGLA